MLFRLLLRALAPVTLALSVFAQGPVVLLGIDAEDGGVGGHGPLTAYRDTIANGIIPNISNGGTGMLVIGSGKAPSDNVTTWFTALAASLFIPVTHVNGPANIAAQNFSGFAIVAIASSVAQTPGGGLTLVENTALTDRASDIAQHVNGGGGLFGLSQAGLTTPYGYLGAVGAFTFGFPAQFSNITPTAAGLAVGITNTNLDVCCWHDEYLTYPGFLSVLATNAATGNACALGGDNVIIVDGITLTPLAAQKAIGTVHTVTATVADTLGNPIVGASVTFAVLTGPHAGTNGIGISNAVGQTTFSYTGIAGGIDRIEACFFSSASGMTVCSNIAQAEWAECYQLLGRGGQGSNAMLFGYVFHTHITSVRTTWPVTMIDRPSLRVPILSNGQISFSVQTLMHNPTQFPLNPEQWSQRLRVTVLPGGVVTSDLHDSLNGIHQSLATFVDATGRLFMTFPFTIDGM